MSDTYFKRRQREILSDRLSNYYEVLMDQARRDSYERWVYLVRM